MHDWCASDGLVYNKPRAWAELTALYKKSLV
jgi:hypothetical protein